jgi:hypothetical protein
MSLFLWTIDPRGAKLPSHTKAARLTKFIREQDLYRRASTTYRGSTSGIYKCSDGKFFQLHGSLNPDPVLDMLSLPHDMEVQSSQDARQVFQGKVDQITSADLLHDTEQKRQAGHVCNSFDEYINSEQGQANSHIDLFELRRIPNHTQPPTWWPATAHTSSLRPLAGLKVVDLTRIIAGPSITRGLAELGASVMRVVSPNVPDWTELHIDLNWGKWNTYIDLNTQRGREELTTLIQDADVVVNGYRPGALDKHGFSEQAMMELVSNRARGLIYVQENCYGWYGPYKHRSGWQPTSDACTGVSVGYGKALGSDEPVTALIPNSDYSTGVAGVAATLSALIQRGETGGSYTIDLALSYYNQWLIRSCGAYPAPVWDEMWKSYGQFQLGAADTMEKSAPMVMKLMNERNDSFRDEFFEERRSRILDVDIRCVKPVIQYPDGEVKLCFNIGTRGNGRDAPRWPRNLLTEVIEQPFDKQASNKRSTRVEVIEHVALAV